LLEPAAGTLGSARWGAAKASAAPLAPPLDPPGGDEDERIVRKHDYRVHHGQQRLLSAIAATVSPSTSVSEADVVSSTTRERSTFVAL
jgi:hypothetical protein